MLTAIVATWTLAVFVAGSVAYAQKADSPLAQKLIAGSPWRGPWTFQSPGGGTMKGTVQLDFTAQDGRLEGVLSNVSPANAGPVKSLAVRGDMVGFETKGGVTMQLTLADGRLKGSGSGPGGGTAQWDLTARQ
jgi:hypothetical protein